MRPSSMHEDRETPATPVAEESAGRPEKGEFAATFGMHVAGESDGCVVPMKSPNNPDGTGAEAAEGRRPTKGRARQPTAPRTQSRTSASNGLAARANKRIRFFTITRGKSRMR